MAKRRRRRARDPVDDLVAEALRAKRETRRIEFKREFSKDLPGAWCELLKDIAAMANSGGGVIVIGLENDGSSAGWEADEFLAIDLADITNAFVKYVSDQLDNFEVREGMRRGRKYAAVIVHAQAGSPVIFEKPGTYDDGTGKQKSAFSKGTVYFRHGAKSEPGSAKDLERFVDREVGRQRKDWLQNVRKVVSAPSDAEVVVVSPRSAPAASAVGDVRIVDDPDAPAVARTDFDVTHPHRQKEVISRFNEAAGKKVVGSYDIQSVRVAHRIDRQPKYLHKPKFGSPQYSEAFISWMAREYKKDPQFFEKAKAEKRKRDLATPKKR